MTAVPYTFSVWLRGNVGGEIVWLSATPDGATYFRQQCVLTTIWQRFSLTTGNLTAATWFWIIGTDRRDTQQAATPAQTIFTWGGQIEALPYMSSYIPTTSASVTRARDSLYYPIPAAVPGYTTNYSLFMDFIPYDASKVVGGISDASFGANTSYFSNSQWQCGGAIGAVPLLTSGTINKQCATVVGGGTTKLSNNGGVPGSGTGAATQSGATRLAVGSDPWSLTTTFGGWMRATKYWPRVLSDSEMIAATTLAGPTLSLDFMQPGTLDPRITFTRASSATYTDASGFIQTAAVNAPRWDYKAGVLQGLLIEEQRTNVMFPSSGFAANWFPNLMTVTPGQAGAPDGSATFTRFAETAGTGAHYNLAGIPSQPANAQITFSVYARAQENRYLQFSFDDTTSNIIFATFDLQTGTVSGPLTVQGSGTAGSATIQSIGGGTYRCSISGSIPTAVNRIILVMANSGNMGWLASYAGNPANGLLVFGVQIEQGAFPTSYIPTTAASVTRAQDQCLISAANMTPWFAPPGGSWFAEFVYFDPAPNNSRLIGPGVTPAGSGPSPLHITPPAVRAGQYDGISGMTAANGLPVNVINKMASTWVVGQAKLCGNAGAIATSATLTAGYGVFTAQGIKIFTVADPGTVDNTSGYIRRVQYWNRALSDAEMQTVTT